MKNNPFLHIDEENRTVHNSLWESNSLISQADKLISNSIPRSGKCDDVILEMNRLVANMYYDHYNNGGGNEGRWPKSGWGKDFREALAQSDFDKDTKRLIRENFSAVNKMIGKYGATAKNSGFRFNSALEELTSNLIYHSALLKFPKEINAIEKKLEMAKKQGIVISKGNCKVSIFVGNTIEESTINLQTKGSQATGAQAYNNLSDIQDATKEAFEYLSEATTYGDDMRKININVRDLRSKNSEPSDHFSTFFFRSQQDENFELDVKSPVFNENGVDNGIVFLTKNTSENTDNKPEANELMLEIKVDPSTLRQGINSKETVAQINNIVRSLQYSFMSTIDNVVDMAVNLRRSQEEALAR